jgi:hypothetical protein
MQRGPCTWKAATRQCQSGAVKFEFRLGAASNRFGGLRLRSAWFSLIESDMEDRQNLPACDNRRID